MDIELQEKLLERYPKLYREKLQFECGSGWYELIDRLSEKLNERLCAIISSDGDEIFLPYVIQVKEKFGTLRFYMSGATDEMWNDIAIAESESAITCEVCGRAGKTLGTRWYATRCPEHEEKYG